MFPSGSSWRKSSRACLGVAFHEAGAVAELGERLDQVRPGPARTAEIGLVEVGGDLGQVVALGGSAAGPGRPASHRPPGGPGRRRLGHLDRSARGLVEVLLADAPRSARAPCPAEVGLAPVAGSPACSCSVATSARRLATWVSTVLDGVLELPPLAAAWATRPRDLGLGGHQVRLGRADGGLLDRDLNPVRLLVELDQQVPLLDAVVVVHEDPGHLARHPGGHEGHVAVDVGVVGGDRVQHRLHRGLQEISSDRQCGPLPPLARVSPRCDAGLASVGLGGPSAGSVFGGSVLASVIV